MQTSEDQERRLREAVAKSSRLQEENIMMQDASKVSTKTSHKTVV